MDDPLTRIDDALLRLRRFVQAPVGELSPGSGELADMSTVLVVDAVEQATSAGQPTTVGDVAKRLLVAPSTASRLVERASETGMVTRERSAEDSRRATLALTGEGHALAARAREYRRTRLAGALGSWSAQRVEGFATDLQDFAQATGAARKAGQP